MNSKLNFYERVKLESGEWEFRIDEIRKIRQEWGPLVAATLRSIIGNSWINWHSLLPTRQDYLIAGTQEALKAEAGVGFNFNTVIENYKNLNQIETSAIINSNLFWQRKAVELLIDLILVRAAGDAYIEKSFYRGKLKSLKHQKVDLEIAFGCAGLKFENAISHLENELKKVPPSSFDRLVGAPYKTRLEEARKLADQNAQFVLGGYFDFSVRSGHVHFSLAHAYRETVHPLIAIRQPVWTIYALSRIAVVLAELAGCHSRSEIQDLSNLSFTSLIPGPLLESFQREWSAGQSVDIQIGEEPQEATVIEVQTSPTGLKKLLIQLQDGSRTWFPSIAATPK